MADKILHKRSLTPGSVPTTASLETGELAINVNDGKLFLRQSGSVDQIVNIGESASFASTASFAAGGNGVFTGSFTGSYAGDGTGLYNIPASGIVGLNLSQISSGSVSASISPDSGLQVNTNVTATAFTGSLAGTASYATSASQAVTASYALTGLTFIRRSDYTASLDPNINFLYLGEALSGSAESALVWSISRLAISSSGATLTQTTSSAAWTDRYIYTYL
jgi:hypothetical protein